MNLTQNGYTQNIRYSQSIRYAHGLGPAHGAGSSSLRFPKPYRLLVSIGNTNTLIFLIQPVNKEIGDAVLPLGQLKSD